jgi:hypothetical protein
MCLHFIKFITSSLLAAEAFFLWFRCVSSFLEFLRFQKRFFQDDHAMQWRLHFVEFRGEFEAVGSLRWMNTKIPEASQELSKEFSEPDKPLESFSRIS